MYRAVSKAAMEQLYPQWHSAEKNDTKRVGYFSAEFLMGKMIESNLLNMGLLKEVRTLFRENDIDEKVFDEVADAALGNGGLGRLAACYLDAAATQTIPMDGYGIRYRYGLFRQGVENGFQKELPDDWTAWTDPWSIRREEESVSVTFDGETVKAVPYDMPVIGYGCKMINTLRLWQCEAEHPFDFTLFNEQKHEAAFEDSVHAQSISAVLYPNDQDDCGKKLRLKQQYFFCSASLKDMFRRYTKRYGKDYTQFHKRYAIQLNDTHPVVSIPECIRLLVEEGGLTLETAVDVTRKTMAYTNHTIMPEALETWPVELFCEVLPQVYPYVVQLDRLLTKELAQKGISQCEKMAIIQDGRIHMAHMAVFGSHSVNGVAQLHTELLKTSVLSQWYTVYPHRFNNKTNGITQRRWLLLSNEELSRLITDTIGNRWITDLKVLEELKPYKEDESFLETLEQIKMKKKEQLSHFLKQRTGISLRTDFLLDVQVKRIHEYKRQLLNAFSIWDTYQGLKNGRISDFTPTAYLFAGKAAPGYFRAKGIVKYICSIAKVINEDPTMKDKMQVIFVPDYNVSCAEKIIPAADISEQISTAGTEASGTGNMKFMLNGAVTLGTYDGANIEIVKQAGAENNYIFGARVEEIKQLEEQDGYDPKAILKSEKRINKTVETLIDGTVCDDNSGMFSELYSSLTMGASWHKPDAYFLIHDFLSYCEMRLRVNRDYTNRKEFSQKRLMNIAGAGYFSADRAILQYADEIWDVSVNKEQR